MTSNLPMSDPNPTLSTETIAGIIIGVVGGAAAVAAACFYWRRWKRSKGNFTGLHETERAVDPEEEFVSGGSSFSASVHDRRGGYGHRQQPSVSLEPLLLPSSPQSPQDILARSSSGSAPQIPPDWSYYLPPILPNIASDHNYPSLYDTDDPFARIQRTILPTSPTHHTPVSPTRRVSHEVPLEQYSRHTTKNPGTDVPLFINRTRTRHSGPDFFSSRASTSLFSPVNPSQSMSSRTGSEAVHLQLSADAPPPPPPKPQISILSTVAESTTSNGSREEAHRPRTAGSISPKSLYSQESAPHLSHPPEPSPPPPPLPSPSSKRGKSSLRYSRTLKLSLSDLSTVMESSTSTSAPPSSPKSEMQKKSSRTFSELETSSSLSVAHSHNTPAPEYASLPLLSSNNAFGKSGSTPSTLSPSSSSRTTRYPSLTPSSLGLSSSGSAPHADSATEWHRPPVGLNALKDLRILDLPNPHGPTQATPHAPADQQLEADKKCETETLKARLRTHSPCSVAEVERRPVVQCGIANIDVTL